MLREEDTSHLRIETDFGDGFVRLRTSEAERRQAAQDITCSEDIVLELLRNARDAHASHIFIASSRSAEMRRLLCIDDGEGIPVAMHSRIFEARVTSKLDTSHRDKWGYHGRGMALYSIAVNSEEARVCYSKPGLGTSLLVEASTVDLGEKSDQSTFPSFILSDDKQVSVRGPRNIIRTACEFALDSRGACSVYLASPVDIAACLYAYGGDTLSAVERAFCTDYASIPLVKRLATSADPAMFCDIASGLGLEISQRSARRIMDGHVEAPSSLLEQIRLIRSDSEEPSSESSHRTVRRSERLDAVHFSHEDIAALTSHIQSGFSELADRYYLESDVSIDVRHRKGELRIGIPLVKKDA